MSSVSPTLSYRPAFLRLYEEVCSESVKWTQALMATQDEHMPIRGKLSALNLQADILRYHLNKRLTQRRDLLQLARSWQGNARRLRAQAATLENASAHYALGAAETFECSACYLFGEAAAESEESEENEEGPVK